MSVTAKIIFAGVAFLAAWIPATACAQAQNSNSVSVAGLVVSPAILEIAGGPGQTVAKDFYIQNISDSAMPVTATLDRLRPNEPEIDRGLSGSFNSASWVKINEPHHILDVKERRKITATITIPKNAEPGGHYATVVWQPLVPTVASKNDTAKIAPQVGVLVFITVPGDIKYNVGLTNKLGRLQWLSQIPINAEFSNTGTIHILPIAKTTVKNIFGHIKAELPLEPSIVLPNTAKSFEATWKNPPLFGIYSAETTATYGPGQVQITSGKTYLVVIQWLPLILIIPLSVGVVLFVLKTHRRWPNAWRAFKNK